MNPLFCKYVLQHVEKRQAFSEIIFI